VITVSVVVVETHQLSFNDSIGTRVQINLQKKSFASGFQRKLAYNRNWYETVVTPEVGDEGNAKDASAWG
jgi:hypothetical protein